MTKDDAAQDKLQWHTAFLQAIQMELKDYREYLEFQYEYHLTSAPLQIDLLIIKKPRELTIDKNIARIFRSDNVVEYKSPEDYLSVRKLPEDENLWLNSLRGGLKKSSLNVIYEEEKKQEREINIDAYMDVVFRANRKTLKEVNKMGWRNTVVEILDEEGVLPQVIEAIAEKREERGRERTARNLLARSMPIEDIAQVTELPIEKIRLLAAVH